ncbi:dihydroorotase [Cucumibacter marinus]|uniref:dihydroorotase n=1 Tax=Cucumibacter marinus TaxID=1121252 RepID=UPI000404DCAE|nr:dihydroorotase [Cucumibacter marinus]
MTALVIENARLMDPATDRDEKGALLVENGVITETAAGAAPGAPDGAQRIDAKGKVLAPGLVDLRVFTGEPGHEFRETLQSAAEAAAAGGVTSMLVMPDTEPVIDSPALVNYILDRARDYPARIYPAAAITKGLEGNEITEFGLLKSAGARAFAEGRKSIANAAVIQAAMLYARNFGMPLIHLPYEASLGADGVMNEGAVATLRGLRGIPREAETIPLARDLQLAEKTGARYHAAQISTARSADLIRFSRESCSTISAGVSINSLSLNENDIGPYRTFFKLSPPLRHENDRQAIVDALADGTISILHSDHDPQDTEMKRRPFAEAADGAIGLETLLAAALRIVHDGTVPLMTVLKALTINPASLIGIEAGSLAKGSPADLVLIDLDKPWLVRETEIRSRARNTTFEGARMTGKVVMTFVGGKTVYADAS